MTRRGIRRLAALAGIVTIGAAALAVWFVVDSAARQKQTEEAYAQGMIHYESGREIERGHDELREQGLEIDDDLDPDDDYALALPFLGKAIARIKDDPELLKAYALCRFAVEAPNKKHIPRAIGAADTAVNLAPSDPEAKQILLKLYWKAPYLTELVDLSGRMLESDPSLYTARVWRIESLQSLGRDEEAMADADALVEQHPDRLPVHIRWDAVAKRNGLSDLDRLEHARTIRPRFDDDPVYLAWLSQIESMTGNTEESIAAARAAALLNPVSSEQVNSLVAWLRELHGTLIERNPDAPLAQPTLLELADQLFARALDDPELGSAVAAQAARRAWWTNRTDEARAFAARIGPDAHAADAFWAALVLIGDQPSLGEPIESESVAPLARQLANDDDLLLLLESMDRLRKGSFEAVARSLASFEPEEPVRQPIADYLRGVALARMGDFRGASIALRAAAEDLNIPRDRAWKALGDACVAEGYLENAAFAYEGMANQGLNGNLNKIDVALKRAEQSTDPRVAAQAIDALRVILDENESTPVIEVRHARAMILGGETPEGIELARTLLNADPPPDPIGTVNLVRALRLYEPDLSNEMLATMAARTGSIDLLAEQARLLATDDKLDEARMLLEKQIEERTAEAALPYRRALIRLLDQYDSEDATGAAAQLSDDYQESGTAQLAALRTKAIWKDHAASRLAISRLRDVMGVNSLAWQIFDVRATLEDNPTDQELSEILVNERGVDLGDILREAPDDFEALMLTARTYRMIAERHAEKGRPNEASLSIDQAALYYSLAAGPGPQASAFKPYIEMLTEAARTIDAENALSRFGEIAQQHIPKEALRQRRDLFLNAGRFSEAAHDQQYLAGYGTPESVLDLADMHLRAGEEREAITVIDEFLANREWDADYLEAAADLLIDAGAVARALEVFGQLPDPYDGQPRDAVIAHALSRSGRPLDALPYQTAAARQLGTVESWLTAIRIAGAIGDDDLLNRTVAEASEAMPDSPEIAVYSGESPLRGYSLAIATQAEPSDDPAMVEFIASALAHGRGEIGDADFLDRLERLCSTNPELLQAWRTRIDFNFELGQIAEGIRIARDAAEAQPESPEALRLLVESLRGESMSAEAIEYAERLIDMSGTDPYRPTIILGILEADLGNFERVIDLLSGYRDRLETDSLEDPDPGLTALAVAFAGVGNAAEASSLFASRLDAGDINWQNTAMLAAAALPGTETDARREWLGMVTHDAFAMPRAGQYIVLARFSGDVADALRAIHLADTVGAPDSSDWLWFRAQAEMFAGEIQRAEASFKRVMELEPNEAIVPAALGELLSRQDGREDDALEMLARALSLLDADSTGLAAEIGVSRARALLGLGRPDDALESLQPLLDRDNPSAAALTLAGKSYLVQGNLIRAAELEEQAQASRGLDHRTQSELDALAAGLR